MGWGAAIGSLAGGLIGGFGAKNQGTTKTSYSYTPQQNQVQSQTAGGISEALKQAETPYNATPEYQSSLNSINNTYSSPAAMEAIQQPLADRGFAQSGLTAGSLLSQQLAGAGAKANAASQASIYSNQSSLSRLLGAIGAGNQYGFANPQGTNVQSGSGLAGALSGASSGALGYGVSLPAALSGSGINMPGWWGGGSQSNGSYGGQYDASGNYIGE